MAIHHETVRPARAARIWKGFYIHLAAYVGVNALLFGINFAVSPGRLWFLWPLAGWGVGVLAHLVATYMVTSPARG